MPYATADARAQMLDTIGTAADKLSVALAELTGAYELLDERTAERVEDDLFSPVRTAYGRARRAHAAFAQRHELPERAFEPAPAPAPGHGVKELLEASMQAVASCDAELAELQDSMLPVEVGDAALRAELEQVRTGIGGFGGRARELLRTFGR